MKHVFVVTYGRSGSTVLINLLNSLDGVCIRGENGGLIVDLARAVTRARQAVEQFGTGGREPSDPWYGIDRLDHERFARALANGFRDNVLQPPAGTRTCGFKEIRYTPNWMSDDEFAETIDFLLSAFSEARIIFNTRDAAAVAKSGWWARQKRAEVFAIVARCDSRFETAHARYPDKTFMTDHGDYDRNPDGFRPLLDWLGEDMPQERLEAVSAERLSHLQKPPPPRGGPFRFWLRGIAGLGEWFDVHARRTRN